MKMNKVNTLFIFIKGSLSEEYEEISNRKDRGNLDNKRSDYGYNSNSYNNRENLSDMSEERIYHNPSPNDNQYYNNRNQDHYSRHQKYNNRNYQNNINRANDRKDYRSNKNSNMKRDHNDQDQNFNQYINYDNKQSRLTNRGGRMKQTHPRDYHSASRSHSRSYNDNQSFSKHNPKSSSQEKAIFDTKRDNSAIRDSIDTKDNAGNHPKEFKKRFNYLAVLPKNFLRFIDEDFNNLMKDVFNIK